MNGTSELAYRYTSTLQDYLAHRNEAHLQLAYELGRCGLADGISMLDLASVHHQAVADVLRHTAPTDRPSVVRAAAGFLIETLSPFEMTHRCFRERAIALRHLHEELEQEIRRMAHSLHDEAGQLLASVYLGLKEIETDLPLAGRARILRVNVLLNQVEEHLRRIAHELRPMALDDLGLVPALQFLSEGVSMRSGVAVTIEASSLGSVPPLLETAIYRIVQEALANVVRHAGASQVSVHLWRDGQIIRCQVCDDGCGFDVAAVLARRGAERGLGLAGIQERVAALGGTLHLDSAGARGTTLDVALSVETGESDVVGYPAGR